MKEPLWLKRGWVDALHFQQLLRFGGSFGIRDKGAVEPSLARPLAKWEYTETRDLPTLATAYAYALCRNHGYVDGNKRIGFMAMAVFLELNGWTLDADEADVVRVMSALAGGEVAEDVLVYWVQAHSMAVPSSESPPPDLPSHDANPDV